MGWMEEGKGTRDLIGEISHMAGYPSTPRGRRHYAVEDVIQTLSPSTLQTFREEMVVGEKIIVGGTGGVDHDLFVDLVDKYLGDIPSSTPSSQSHQRVVSEYKGSLYKHHIPHEASDQFPRFAITFPTKGWESKEFVIACLVQKLLGGGSSFSSGGPGKGMYSRLYSNVFGKHNWVETAEACIDVHKDGTLFGIVGACYAPNLGALTQVLMEELALLFAREIPDEQFLRAQKMLKSSVFYNLESRLLSCEDIVRSTLAYGKRKDVQVIAAEIDSITKEDVKKVVKDAMLNSNPTIAAVGEQLSALPEYDEVLKWFGK